MNEPCLCGALDCRACRGSDAYDPDAEDDDGTVDLLAEIRDWLTDAQIAHQNGDEAKARQCVRELIATLEPFAES